MKGRQDPRYFTRESVLTGLHGIDSNSSYGLSHLGRSALLDSGSPAPALGASSSERNAGMVKSPSYAESPAWLPARGSPEPSRLRSPPPLATLAASSASTPDVGGAARLGRRQPLKARTSPAPDVAGAAGCSGHDPRAPPKRSAPAAALVVLGVLGVWGEVGVFGGPRAVSSISSPAAGGTGQGGGLTCHCRGQPAAGAASAGSSESCRVQALPRARAPRATRAAPRPSAHRSGANSGRLIRRPPGRPPTEVSMTEPGAA